MIFTERRLHNSNTESSKKKACKGASLSVRSVFHESSTCKALLTSRRTTRDPPLSSKPWTLGELGIPEPWCATEGETEGPRRCNVGGDQCNVGEERGRGGDSESAAAETVSLLYRWSCICNSPAHTLPALCSSNSGRVASVHSALCSFALFFFAKLCGPQLFGNTCEVLEEWFETPTSLERRLRPPPPRRCSGGTCRVIPGTQGAISRG